MQVLHEICQADIQLNLYCDDTDTLCPLDEDNFFVTLSDPITDSNDAIKFYSLSVFSDYQYVGQHLIYMQAEDKVSGGKSEFTLQVIEIIDPCQAQILSINSDLNRLEYTL